MTYEPFARGPFAVGVRTVSVVARAAGAGGTTRLPLEVWYPADDALVGADVDPARRDRYQMIPAMPAAWQSAVRDAPARSVGAGGAAPRWPLVVFSHGLGGHRRQSTFLCTHLASHGYVVAAPDHVGTTFADAIGMFTGGVGGAGASRMLGWVQGGIAQRPLDAVAVIDALTGGAIAELAARVDAGHVGMCGHSFGGWTTLATVARDARVRAAVVLAPAGGRGAYPGDPLPGALALDWSREVPSLFVVAEKDSILPLASTRDLYARAPSPKRLVVLAAADHMHYLDGAQRAHDMFRLMPVAFAPIVGEILAFSQLMPAPAAQAAVRGLSLAHFDAFVRGDAGARGWLRGDVAGALAAHGAAVL